MGKILPTVILLTLQVVKYYPLQQSVSFDTISLPNP